MSEPIEPGEPSESWDAKPTWKTWVAALRSGKYQQGQGYLWSYRGYCCWGVACDIVNSNEWKPSKDAGKHIFEYEGNCGVPPYSVVKALGVEKLSVSKYMNMNDYRSHDFDDIADEIEKEMSK